MNDLRFGDNLTSPCSFNTLRNEIKLMYPRTGYKRLYMNLLTWYYLRTNMRAKNS